ncbi:hypothetical protein GCM10017673_56550 [Streptosporangium violaceochromogenes]|nr:hypothetical protein GCM10017673_56550 [Streptosporangium violaceochromogenes]
MNLDELLALPERDRLKRLKSLPGAEREAILDELRKRQQAFRDSYDGPVHRYVPSAEEGRCIDPDDFAD